MLCALTGQWHKNQPAQHQKRHAYHAGDDNPNQTRRNQKPAHISRKLFDTLAGLLIVRAIADGLLANAILALAVETPEGHSAR